jgi:thioredoxin 1
LAIELDRDSYQSQVLESKEPVMVDFWGPQCRPCLALMPTVEELEKNYAGRLKVAKVNAVQNRMLCAKLRVLSLPTYLFYNDGVEVNRLVGDSITKSDLIDAIKGVLD